MAQRVLGIVKWWNDTKGFGYIEQLNGPDVFVHFSALNMSGSKNLSESQRVEFSIEKGPKGLEAVNVTPINQEFTSEGKPPTPISMQVQELASEEKPVTQTTTQVPPSIFPKTRNEILTSNNQSHQSLRVFLCHSSNDKPLVRKLYQQLQSDDFDPWLDEEKILAGQDWRQEITKAVRRADVVVICLSRGSVSKAGFVQKEIKDALDIADEQPEGAIYLIPLKLEECEVPERLSRWQWVNYFDTKGYEKLFNALQARASAK
jgi:cold shock CspA family protein